MLTGGSGQIRPGYFIFKDKTTRKTMLHAVIFLYEKFQERYDNMFFSVYYPFIDAKTKYKLKEEIKRLDSIFILRLNLSKVISKLKETSLSLTYDKENVLNYTLISSVNEETIGKGAELTVTLNNPESDINDDLFYKIQLDYGNENLKDMHLILTPDADEAAKYLENHTDFSC
ncbi:hypothetical protein CDIK_1746 [Cucumispora dikerogammari]|nr:hypothetical protein CDIK_1746 [Cucumispora dikerogammari]